MLSGTPSPSVSLAVEVGNKSRIGVDTGEVKVSEDDTIVGGEILVSGGLIGVRFPNMIV
jgi:hypothetical protein